MVVGEQHLVPVGRRTLIALGLGQSGILLAHLGALVAVIVLHVDKLHVDLRAHWTALGQVRQLVVLAQAEVVRPRQLRRRALVVQPSERELNLIRRQLAAVVEVVAGGQRYVI